jgi:hypothetical protein
MSKEFFHIGGARQTYSRSILFNTDSISDNLSAGKAAIRRSTFALSTPAMPSTLMTDSCRSHGGFGKLTSHSPPRISVVIGTTTDMFRWLSHLATETTTQGRTLAAMPKSTKTTSPRLKFVIIHIRRRTEFFPCVSHKIFHGCFLFALSRDEFQVIKDFAQYRFRLVLDFLDQNFLCAHGVNYPHSADLGKRVFLSFPHCDCRPTLPNYLKPRIHIYEQRIHPHRRGAGA